MREDRAIRGAGPLPTTTDEADRALRRIQAEGAQVRRRRLGLLAGAIALLICAAFWVGALLGMPTGTNPWQNLASAGLAALGAGWALQQARRADVLLGRLQHQGSALRVVRAALASEVAPALLTADDDARDAEPAAVGAPLAAHAPRGFLGTAAATAAVGVMIVVAATEVHRGSVEEVAGPLRRWFFLERVPDPAMLGFQLVVDHAGDWILDEHAEAVGGRALINLAGVHGEPPALMIAERLSARDMRLMTRCKVAPRYPEQACGVVFRYQDERSYYVARVDVPTHSVVLGAVVDGIERPLQRAPAALEPSVWQELVVEARGQHITVAWNAVPLLDVRDASLPGPGAVGLWVPPECVAYFDELAVQPIGSLLDTGNLLSSLLR